MDSVHLPFVLCLSLQNNLASSKESMYYQAQIAVFFRVKIFLIFFDLINMILIHKKKFVREKKNDPSNSPDFDF